jgi:hypothetical protein
MLSQKTNSLESSLWRGRWGWDKLGICEFVGRNLCLALGGWFCSYLWVVVAGEKPSLGPAAEALVLLTTPKRKVLKSSRMRGDAHFAQRSYAATKRRPCLCALRCASGFPKCGAEKWAKKNSPFLARWAKRCSNNFFALWCAPNFAAQSECAPAQARAVFGCCTLAQKKGGGTNTGSTCRCAARPSDVGEVERE